MQFYPSTLRDSPVGQVVNRISHGRYLPYLDQQVGFQLPREWSDALQARQCRFGTSSSSSAGTLEERPTSTCPTLFGDSENKSSKPQTPSESPLATRRQSLAVPPSAATTTPSMARQSSDVEADPEKQSQALREAIRPPHLPIKLHEASAANKDVVIVGWYDADDPENPQNWPLRRKVLTTVLISALTFSVYMGAAIYTPSIPGIMAEFDVSQRKAALGLSLYIAAIGLGPLVLSPLSEIPAIGRNKVYFVSLFLFVVFSIPGALANNWNTLMAMRFFQGFFASPALSTGGATLGEIWSPQVIAYFIATWAVGAVCGPVMGPIISGFAAMNSSWRWSMRLLLTVAGVALIGLSFSLPETYPGTILLERARRLRKLTGDDRLRSQSELDQAAIKPAELVKTALIRPLVLSKEPALLFGNIYLGLSYGIFYLFFESFPLVFAKYNFNLGESSLPFLAVLAGAILTLPPYLAYLRYVVEPRFRRDGKIVPESRLEVALVAAVFIPTAQLVWGWSANRTHWIVPLIGAALYIPGLFLLFQGLLSYQPMSYPTVAASVMAANAFARSSIASAFPLFGDLYYQRLGVDIGSTILAAITIVMIPFLYLLKRYGHVLRAKSKHATA